MTRLVPPQEVVSSWKPDQQAKHNKAMGNNVVDGKRRVASDAKTREAFIHDAVKAYNEDCNRLAKLNDKREWILKVMRYRPFIGKDRLFERLDELDKKIAAIKSDLDYNRQNISNSLPNSIPLPPIVPEPITQFYVCEGAILMCPCAIPIFTPNFTPDPNRTVFFEEKKMGNISDCKFGVNIKGMGICQTLTLNCMCPTPCGAQIIGVWTPGKATVLIQGAPALVSTDTIQCAIGGRVIVQPQPSRMGDGAKEAIKGKLKDVRDNKTEDLLKKTKFFKEGGKYSKLAKSSGFGFAIGAGYDLLVYGFDVATGQNKNARNYDELGDKASEYWNNISNTSGIDESMENAGYLIRGGFGLLGETISATGGEIGGDVGAVIGGGVGTVVGGVGDTAATIAEGIVGAGESGGAGVAVYVASVNGDTRMNGDADIFGDYDSLYLD